MSDQPQEAASSSTSVPSLGRFMTSEVFELVASDDVCFYVNKDILASQSKPFREATSGTWKESTDRRIDLKDWDSDTVARLVEFLYVRNYPYPDPSPLGEPESMAIAQSAPQPTPESAESEVDISRPLTPLDECLQKCIPPDEDAPIPDEERLADFDPTDYDYEDILLAHAKVYALANYKSVDTLRTLALKRLLLVLCRLHPLSPASHISLNIVDFAHYVYANTDHLVRSEEPLRKLTSQFIALNFAAFQTEPKAVELVAMGGDFVKDLMAKICRRIPEPEGGWLTLPGERFISGVKILCSAALPAERVIEINKGDSNLSSPYGAPMWLIPEYTTSLKDACTNFTVSNTYTGELNGQDRAAFHPENRYPLPVKERSVLEKITEIALMRFNQQDTVDFKSKGYDGISSDFANRSTTNSTNSLHLVWKTVKRKRG